jgi:hypothetical protein
MRQARSQVARILPNARVLTSEITVLIRSVSAVVAISLIVVACSQGSSGAVPIGPGGDQIVFTGDQKADWAQIVALEDQAKALIKAEGCSTAAQCRTAAVGSRACGGPRYYLVYCSQTTDSAALFRKLDAVAAAEHEYNTRYKLVSTCEFRMPPTVALIGGSCQAQLAPQ